MHVRCITNQKEHNLNESRLMLFPMEKNAHSGGGTVSSPGVRASNNGVMGQKTLKCNSCSLYHENLSFLRINCLRYHKLHVFYLDGYSSAVYMHKEEPDQNRTPVPVTMYIIDG